MSNSLGQKSKSSDFLNEPLQEYDCNNVEQKFIKTITKNNNAAMPRKIEILSENHKDDESKVFEHVDIKEKINRFASKSISNFNNSEIALSININGDTNSAELENQPEKTEPVATVDTFPCITTSRINSLQRNMPIKLENRSTLVSPVRKRSICVTTNNNLVIIKQSSGIVSTTNTTSNDDTSNDSANSTFSEDNSNMLLLGGDNQTNQMKSVAEHSSDSSSATSESTSSSVSFSSSISMSSSSSSEKLPSPPGTNLKINFNPIKFEENYEKIKNAFVSQVRAVWQQGRSFIPEYQIKSKIRDEFYSNIMDELWWV